MTQHCSRCECSIDEPVDRHANYVIHSDFAEPEEQEVHYALVHTEDTKKKAKEMAEKLDRPLDDVSAEMANPDAPETVSVSHGTKVEEREGGTVETADMRDEEFSVPVEEFDEVEVASPNVVQDEEDVAYVETRVEERDRQKTGLVCPDCTDSDDEIIWGPNK